MKNTEIAERALAATRNWLERAVIGLNLCPFAKGPHVKGQIRWVVSSATTTDALTEELFAELERLQAADPEQLETTLLIHPFVLNDFDDYNQFLDVADAAIAALRLDGVIQIASFHPDYCFADAQPDDPSNLTNRSPYPLLHLIREASIDRAVAATPDAADIYERNIAAVTRLGFDGWRRLLAGE